ncbi:MAG: winged helix-turn-helix transcriptional regulator [Dehalococcoidia bacterium]|nr:winged helix-turn-helix transcriptional regulator [Dehalococcoidia bacterium]
MPAELGAPTSLASRVRVAVSPVTELCFALFVIESRARDRHREVPAWLQAMTEGEDELRQRVLAFWDESDYDEWGELLLLAWKAGAVLADDVETMVSRVEMAARDAFAVPELPTEPPIVQQIIAARLARLQEDEALRARYVALIRDVWAFVRPRWAEEGERTATASARAIAQAVRGAESLEAVLPPTHLARRERFEPLVRDALERGQVVIVPLGLSGEGQYFFAFPDLLLIGYGPRSEAKAERWRELAERAATRFKVLSDPTRVMLLSHLAASPMSITDLASYYGFSQPTVSVHIKMLREAGLLESEKSGSHTLYRAPEAVVREYIEGAETDILAHRQLHCEAPVMRADYTAGSGR